ncbi:hypothetical protein A6R68_04966 [Neotoma lepida]|uniref:Uncharacterized protein n=1 Tax=Neotoma lepida TaxID=56216 RepID=A0A1A6GJP2_NEOLE|nr:hypothetical protein A6R68_04966 [Neotoma lepida]
MTKKQKVKDKDQLDVLHPIFHKEEGEGSYQCFGEGIRDLEGREGARVTAANRSPRQGSSSNPRPITGCSGDKQVTILIVPLLTLMSSIGPEAAEEALALTTAEEKPKEGVKMENNSHINLKVAGRWFCSAVED